MSVLVLLLFFLPLFQCAWYSSCGYRPDAIDQLLTSFNSKLFGQPMALQELTAQAAAHIAKPNPNKPLVFSLHGHTGTGKTYSTRLLAESIYTERSVKKNVHRDNGGRYASAEHLEAYVSIFETKFHEAVKECPYSMFVIDEVHLMTPGLLDRLKHYFDHDSIVNGVSYVNCIFIFISNIGATDLLNKIAHKGTQLPYTQVAALLREYLLSQIVGFQKQIPFELLMKDSVIRYIPYFPLFRETVVECFNYELTLFLRKLKSERKILDFEIPSKNLLNWLSTKLQYEHVSVTGCKQVTETLNTVVEYAFLRGNIDEPYQPVFPFNYFRKVWLRPLFHDKIVELFPPNDLTSDLVYIKATTMPLVETKYEL